MQDCNDDYWWGCVGAILASAGGPEVGITAAIIVMGQFSTCKKRAKRDYIYCMQ